MLTDGMSTGNMLVIEKVSLPCIRAPVVLSALQPLISWLVAESPTPPLSFGRNDYSGGGADFGFRILDGDFGRGLCGVRTFILSRL